MNLQHAGYATNRKQLLTFAAILLMSFALLPLVTSPIAVAEEKKNEEKQEKEKEKKNNEFDKVITIGVKPGQMKYDLEKFSVPAGGNIKLIFDNSDGTLQHNVLILTPGDQDHAVSLAKEAWSMPNPINNDYVPDSDDVLFATSLLSPGEKETITFTAPKKPGNHPFVCTMPGHAMSMNGMMHVKASENKPSFDKVITLGVKPGQMKYDLEEFSVPAGGNIKLIFDNSDGTLQHNVLILTPGDQDHAVSLAQKAWSMPKPIKNDYVPDSDDVLFATSLLSPGEKETITFTAPDEPGDHPYVCTMPGHAMSMNGMMHVKDNEKGKEQSKKDTTKANKKSDTTNKKKKSKKTSKKDTGNNQKVSRGK